MAINVTKVNTGWLFNPDIRFVMPPFQRRYVWTEEAQWQPLWEDVQDLADRSLAGGGLVEDDDHFLGAVVMRQAINPPNEPPQRVVIDGQQRLTTLQLLIDATHDVLEQENLDEAPFLEKLTVNNPFFWEKNPDLRLKVWPTREDRAAFRAAMHDEEDPAGYENTSIVQAHEYFRGRVHEWLFAEAGSDPKSVPQRSNALTSVLQNRLCLVHIDVDGEEMANRIFETLNARGTPLEAWDLVKTLIYQRAAASMSNDDFEAWFTDDLLKFDDDWWQSEDGSGRNRRAQVDLLINHFLVLENKEEVKGRSANELFRAFRDYANQPLKADQPPIKAIGTMLSRTGDVYRDQLMSPAEGALHADFLERWRVQGHGVLTPVLLWLWSNKVRPEQLEIAVETLDSYFGRRLVCQRSSKDYRELCIGLLRELVANGPKDAGDRTRDYLAERSRGVDTLQWPTDDEMRHTLITTPMYGKLTVARTRMVLKAIELQLQAEEGKRAVPVPVPDTVTIEHLLPQKWEKYWPLEGGNSATDESPAERRNRIKHTIGNLTLTTSNLGSSLSNSAWSKKRPVLAEYGDYRLTKMVRNKETWDEESIEKRSKKLADVLIRMWPRPKDA